MKFFFDAFVLDFDVYSTQHLCNVVFLNTHVAAMLGHFLLIRLFHLVLNMLCLSHREMYLQYLV